MRYNYEKGIFGNVKQLFTYLTKTNNNTSQLQQRTDAITGDNLMVEEV